MNLKIKILEPRGIPHGLKRLLSVLMLEIRLGTTFLILFCAIALPILCITATVLLIIRDQICFKV